MTWAIFLLLTTALAATACLPILVPLQRGIRLLNKKSGADTANWTRYASIAFLWVTPLTGAMIYLAIGEPDGLRPARAVPPPIASIEGAEAIASLPPDERAKAIASMVSSLEARLRAEPNDLDGWRMLARSQSVLGNHERSAAAWREAIRRSQDAPGDWRGLAAALLENGAGNETSVSEELENALRQVIHANPDDPMALFFLGVAAHSKAENETARKYWTRLREQLPDDAPILPRLNEMLASVE